MLERLEALGDAFRGALAPVVVGATDRLHAVRVTLRGAVVGEGGWLGARISGSGQWMLLWCERSEATNGDKREEQAMVDAGVAGTAKVLRVAPGGVRCR